MPDLKLIKNPGYVYDLIFLFCYKYNEDVFAERFDATEEEMKFFGENAKLFDPISDDLYVFFRFIRGKYCFFSENYFHQYTKKLTFDYDLEFVQKEISDYGEFTRNLIKYYFEELDDAQVSECMTSKKHLFEIIKRSDYDDKLKTKLYEFFIDSPGYF